MRSVHELREEELQELRSRWYHQHMDDGTLEEVLGKDVESEDEIPMDVIKTYYEDTLFVDEDFFCNLNQDCEITELDQIEHAVLNQIESDFESQDYDALSEMLQCLLQVEDAKKILINYLSDNFLEDVVEGRIKLRY